MNPWYCFIFSPLWLYFLFNSILCESIHSSLDKIILNCGSAESESFNGRLWSGDAGSKFLTADYEKRTISVPSTPMHNDVPKIPYSTARVFHFDFAYGFPLSPGFKFIRLHFYPATYSGSSHEASFSVVSGQYTLLNNFRPSVMAETFKLSYLTKGFVVMLKEKQLNINFVPSPKAYGFVNGIEIYNLPSNFYNYSGEEASFEMVHRIKVGIYSYDSDDLWDWADDSMYILGSMRGTTIHTPEKTQDPWKDMSNYVAPSYLYSSAKSMGSDDAINMMYNLTWTFLVDPGFKYLVRLHFCEISYEVTQINQRVFTIYINNQTVEKSLDVIALAGAPLVATFRDYIVSVGKETGERQELRLALHPNTDSLIKDAILNGVEIIKLSDPQNNLAAEVKLQPNFRKRKKILLTVIVLGGLGGICLSCLIVMSKLYPKSHSKMPMVSSAHEFKLADIRAATDDFSEALVVGVGGFGKVYKGSLDGGVTHVAIKRKHLHSNQGLHEFETEIHLLSTFSHTNLVSLLGFCLEKTELILVYEYISSGTLRDHLYMRNLSPLSWIQRLNICIGAARGLHYLHTGTDYSIIHRDVKSSNILLDEEWTAKVSDFGLSRIGPTSASSSHVKTEVKGTFGYLDPVYYRNRTLSKKSDVYSFGVLLLEVLCARPAVNTAAVHEANDEISLAEWALHCHRNGEIEHIIDPFLRENVAPQSLITFTEIAVKCLADKRAQRPTMGGVLHNLDLALHLQQAKDHQSKRIQ